MSESLSLLKPIYRWPMIEPGELADYTFDAVDDLTDPNTGLLDPLLSVSITAQPSGAGELALSRVSVAGTKITVWLTAGVPGREYIVMMVGTTTGGRVYPWPIGILCNPFFAVFPQAAPPSLGPGPAATWP